MRSKETKEGVVQEALKGTEFRVLVDGKMVQCCLAGKLYMNFIHILPGDRVRVVLSPDGHRGRVVERLR